VGDAVYGVQGRGGGGDRGAAPQVPPPLLCVLEQLREVKGREITVKWKEEGMWTCPDPTCAKSNFDEREECVQCKLPKSKFVKKKL
jgi:hypothetical protein